MEERDELSLAQTTGEEAAAAGQQESLPQRMSWEQIMADPEYRDCYNRAVQAIVQRRLKNRRDAELELRQLSVKAAEKAREDMLRAFRHLDRLQEQEQALRAEFPDFELMAALSDPAFLRLSAPHTGLSLADAYYALHREEIGRRAAQESLEKLSRSLISGAARPRELRGSGGGSPAAGPGKLSRSEREALRKRIYAAGALKEKIYP